MHGPNLRASDLYQFRGTSGRVELGSRIKTDARILAQKNYFSDGMSKDIEITGRVGGVDRRGPARTIWGKEPGKASGPRFAPPISRPRTYQISDGKRTFHFAHETISGSTKKAIASVIQHDHYVKDEEKVPGLEALFSQVGQDRTDYVVREAVPTDDHGPMIFSNLGDIGEYASAWKTVTETAIRASGKEKAPWLKLRPVQGDAFWQNVLQRNSLPAKAREQMVASGEKWIDVEPDDIKATLVTMRACGWHERATIKGANGRRRRARADQIDYFAGSAPELQRRIVGEMPKELDASAKRRVLEKFTQEFRDRDLPFVCVFHEADENNNPLNGHFHLDYHARPMRKFSRASPPAVPQSLLDAYEKSKAEYAAKGKPYPKNGRVKRQIEIWQEAAANPQPEWEGMWEPDIKFKYRTPGGTGKETHPFVRSVHPDTRSDSWIPNLRKSYAAIVNEELRAVGSETEFYPGKLADLGIDKESDVHLGPKKNWLEKQGHPTLDGNENEQRQWDHQVRELRRQYPLTMRPQDAPDQTLRFVSKAAAMLKERVLSRPNHIHLHAAQRIAADNERRNDHPKKLSGNEFKRTHDLMEDAQEHAQCASILFADYSSWLSEVGAALSHPPAALAPAPSPVTGALDQKSEANVRAAPYTQFAAPDDTVTPSKPMAVVQSASQNVGGAPDDNRSVLELIGKLRRKAIPFDIERTHGDDGKVALVATLDKDAANDAKLPCQFLARTGEERSALMELKRAEMDAHSPPVEANDGSGGVEPLVASKPEPLSQGGIKTDAAMSPISEPVPDAAEVTAAAPISQGTKAVDAAAEEGAWLAAAPKSTSHTETEASATAGSFVFAASFGVPLDAPSLSQTGDGRSTDSTVTAKQDEETRAGPPDPLSAADDPSQAMQSLGLSNADRRQMAKNPFYLLRKSDGKFEILSTKTSRAFKAAAANGGYTEQFARWYARQEAEREELTKLVVQSNYANRSEIDAAINADLANARVKELWKRWERTPLINRAVETALATRRDRERAMANEKEWARKQQLAIQMDFGRGT